MERCVSCGQPLTFVGFDFKGRRVLTCTANLLTAQVEEDVNEYGGAKITGYEWKACDLTQTMYVNREKEKMVRWWKRR